MLSQPILDSLSERYGKPLNVPKGYDLLVEDIIATTKLYISSTTLRRMYGAVQSDVKPSHHSMQTIARYLGYADINAMCDELGIDDYWTPIRKPMLPEDLIAKIEEKFGGKIDTAKQCEALSAAILSEVKEYISTSTLRRLFGFGTPDTRTVSKYVLCLIEKICRRLIAMIINPSRLSNSKTLII